MNRKRQKIRIILTLNFLEFCNFPELFYVYDVLERVYCDKNYATMDDNIALKWVSRNGHLNLVKHLVFKCGITNCKWNLATRYAARNGHYKVVVYLISKGFCKTNCEYVLRDAAGGGHLDIVKYLTKTFRIKLNYHCALRFAFREGHIHIVKYLVSVSEDIKFDIWSIKRAIINGHFNVIQYIFNRNISIFNIREEYINLSFKHNRSKILKLLWSKSDGSIPIPNTIFKSAVVNGNFKVLKYYFDCKTLCIEINFTFLEWTSKKSNFKIIDYIISKGWKITITADDLWNYYAYQYDTSILMNYILTMIAKYNVCQNHRMRDLISTCSNEKFAAYYLVMSKCNIIVHKGELILVLLLPVVLPCG